MFIPAKRLMKYPEGHTSTDLRCCTANPIAQRIKIYASRCVSCTPSISALLNSLQIQKLEAILRDCCYGRD